MNKWQQTYIRNELWLHDSYLITPFETVALPTISAVKRCKACEKIKFSSDFADCELFVDRKLLTCTKCYRKRKRNVAKGIVAEANLTKKCSKCKEVKNISEFDILKAQNKLYNVCSKCNRNPHAKSL